MSKTEELIKIGSFYNQKGDKITPKINEGDRGESVVVRGLDPQLPGLFFILNRTGNDDRPQILMSFIGIDDDGDLVTTQEDYDSVLGNYSKLEEGGFIAIQTSLSGYKPNQTVVTESDMLRRNIKIILSGYSTSEKTSLISQQLPIIKEMILQNLDNRTGLKPVVNN